MDLSSELISQFVRATKTEIPAKKESLAYGTIVIYNEKKYVKLDGSELLTPVTFATNTKENDRVAVTIKNHSAVVTGNLTSPSTSQYDFDNLSDEIGDKITEFEVAIGDMVDVTLLNAVKADVQLLQADNVTIKDQLNAANADIKDLDADNVLIREELTAKSADIEKLQADDVTIKGDLEAANADIESLQAADVTINQKLTAREAEIGELEAVVAEFKEATVEQLDAQKALIDDLEADKISAKDIEGKYANIDFSNIGEAAITKIFADSGLIENITVGDGTITGNLVGVTISGDLIEGNTIKAEKLVVKGSDGLYYKLNVDAGATTSEEVSADDLQNGLHGSAIIAKTITADRLSVTDLVAFDATIGGFVIDDNAIHSSVKTSVGNTTRGIYMDNDGQYAVGDAANFLKYFKDSDGSYKLVIQASQIFLGGSDKNLETVVEEAKTAADSANSVVNNLKFDNRNLLRYTDVGKYFDKWSPYYNDKNTALAVTDDGFLQVGPNNTTAGANGAHPPNSLNLEANTEYTLSFDGYAEDGNVIMNYCYILCDTGNTRIGDSVTYVTLTTNPARYSLTFTTTSAYENCTIMLGHTGTAGSMPTWYVRNVKLEKGDRATDWEPAPEDVNESIANAGDIAMGAQNEAAANATLITNALMAVDSINAMIQMLITGENGESLMTQTDSGWTFSMASIQNTLSSLGQTVGTLNEDSAETKTLIDGLNQSIADLGEYTDYIKFGVDGGKPCIYLGETDSVFKVLITNTDIRFMEGSVVPASISNQALNIETAIVNKEIRQGGFSWNIRSNGNYSLSWKG